MSSSKTNILIYEKIIASGAKNKKSLTIGIKDFVC